MKEIISFIKTINKSIAELIVPQHKYEIVFVMGNSSCDMDSFTCATTLSYLRNIESGFILVKNKEEISYSISKTEVNRVFIPIVNCGDKLSWRLDIDELLRQMNLTEKEFFYFNTAFSYSNGQLSFLPLKELEVNQDKLSYSFILVDHHELDINQKFVSKYVIEIIDHHDDTKFKGKAEYTNLQNYKVEFPRCSNMALIIEDLLANPKLSQLLDVLQQQNFFDIFAAAIVLDSSNFDEKLKNTKWVEKDRETLHNIIRKFKGSLLINGKNPLTENSGDEEIKEYYAEIFKLLSDVKFSPSRNLDLGVDGLVNKDRKDFEVTLKDGSSTKITFASFPVPFNDVVSKYHLSGVTDYLESLSKENGIDLFVTIYRSAEKDTCALFYSTQLSKAKKPYEEESLTHLFKNVSTNLLESKSITKYELIENLEGNSSINIMVTKGSLSRKILWPQVNSFFSEFQI